MEDFYIAIPIHTIPERILVPLVDFVFHSSSTLAETRFPTTSGFLVPVKLL
jgi:hypothetical protein